MGKFKGVRFGTQEPLELYDLANDRAEKTNIAAQHADIVKKMESFLASARTESTYWPTRPRRRQRRGTKPRKAPKK